MRSAMRRLRMGACLPGPTADLPLARGRPLGVASRAGERHRGGKPPGEETRMITDGLSRKEFLRVVGAAGIGGAVAGPGALLHPAGAAATTTPRIDPTDLTFETKAQYRPFEIVARGFEAVDDRFRGHRLRYERFAPAPEHDAGRTRVRGGALTIEGAPFFALFAAADGPVAPYAAVQVDVAALGSAGTVVAGLVADEANFVV